MDVASVMLMVRDERLCISMCKTKVVYGVILFNACYGEKKQNHVLDIMYLAVEFLARALVCRNYCVSKLADDISASDTDSCLRREWAWQFAEFGDSAPQFCWSGMCQDLPSLSIAHWYVVGS